VLEELAALDRLEELVLGGEVVILALHLAATTCTGRRGDGELEVVAPGKQALDERALSGPGRSGDDEELRAVAQRRSSPTSSAR
jgi:hypothetical protein